MLSLQEPDYGQLVCFNVGGKKFYVVSVMCHVSCVMCHVSCVMCHVQAKQNFLCFPNTRLGRLVSGWNFEQKWENAEVQLNSKLHKQIQ